MNYQKGMSSLSLLLVLAVSGFFLLCAFKLIPVYSENQYIVSALQSLRDRDKTVDQMSPSEIHKHLQNFYTVNGVRSKGANNIVVERERNRSIITIYYEVKVPLFYNISVVLDFKNYMDSTKPDECCKAPVDYRPKAKKDD
ncbi:hypothetical protein R50072_18380 [Simiduia litorea]